MSSRLDRVTLKDWLLAAVSGVLTLGGLLMIGRDFNTGIVTLAFFGLCLVHAVYVIVRKRRVQRLGALTATVEGGVPIRQSRQQLAFIGVALLGLGAIMAAFVPRSQLLMVGIGWFLLVVGAVLLAGLATRLLPVGHIQFDPAGLTFATLRGKAMVPWDAVTGLGRGDVHSNPAVMLWVDADAIVAQPAHYRPKLLKQLAWSRGLMGADFVILSATYGIDAPVLIAALQRYLDRPEARQELHRQPRLQA